jgi:hypothetical protein
MTEIVSSELDQILYDSPCTSLPHKVVIALVTGIVLAWFISFSRWFAHTGALHAITPSMALLGALVSISMIAEALRSRIARRVEFSPDKTAIHITRDPGTIDKILLFEVQKVQTESPSGGWSRDPSDVLVIVCFNGEIRRYTFPDDADSPGIAADINVQISKRTPHRLPFRAFVRWHIFRPWKPLLRSLLLRAVFRSALAGPFLFYCLRRSLCWHSRGLRHAQ